MMPPKPENYLVWAILSTVCCCLPFGIVSIVYAAKVDSLYTSKQYEAALEASGKAKMWALIAAGSGVAVGIIYGLLSVSGAALLGGLS